MSPAGRPKGKSIPKVNKKACVQVSSTPRRSTRRKADATPQITKPRSPSPPNIGLATPPPTSPLSAPPTSREKRNTATPKNAPVSSLTESSAQIDDDDAFPLDFMDHGYLEMGISTIHSAKKRKTRRLNSSVQSPKTDPRRKSVPLTPLPSLASRGAKADKISPTKVIGRKRKRRVTQTPRRAERQTIDVADYEDMEDPVQWANKLCDEAIQYAEEQEAAMQRPKDETEDEEVNTLPNGVHIGDPCLVKTSRAEWRAAVLKDFKPGGTGGKRKGNDEYWAQSQVRRGNETGREKAYHRSEIIFLDEDAIATCHREEYDTIAEELKNDADTRPTTPKPRGRRPKFPTPDQFRELSREKQLRLIRPTLLRILNEDYPPAQHRVNLFFEGKLAQLDQLVIYGDITENEVAVVFVPELRRWAERGDRFIGIDPEKAAKEPPRPKGSETYEALSTERRIHFVINVLVPEAVIAICIHSYGLDRDQSEQAAYDAARKELSDLKGEDQNVQWVLVEQRILQARMRKREELKLPAEYLANEAKKDAEDDWYAREFDKTISEKKKTFTHTGRHVSRVNYAE